MRMRRISGFAFLILAVASFGTAGASDEIKEIQADFRAFVEKHKPDDWKGAELGEGLKTRRDFQDEMRQMGRESEAANAYLDLAIEYLLRFPPGRDFGRVLWRVAALTEVQETTAAPVLKTRLGPKVLELMARFPKESDNYHRGRFLAAARHQRMQEYAEEEQILGELLAMPKLSMVYRAKALERLGYSAFLQERPERAMEKFLAAGRFANAGLTGVESLLRAATLQLELGRYERAFETIRVMSRTPAAVRGKSEGAFMMNALIQLAADPAGTKKYWESGEEWMRDWRKIVTKLDASAKVPDVGMPALPGPEIVTRQILQTAEAGDGPAFVDRLDQLARGTRWVPQYFRDFASAIVFVGTRIAPEVRDDLFEFHPPPLRSLRFADAGGLRNRVNFTGWSPLSNWGGPRKGWNASRPTFAKKVASTTR